MASLVSLQKPYLVLNVIIRDVSGLNFKVNTLAIYSRSLKSSFKKKGYLLMIVCLVYTLKSIRNTKVVPFFFITNKAKHPMVIHLVNYVLL